MCNVYAMTASKGEVRKKFRLELFRERTFLRIPGIFPGYDAPVVCENEDGERELVNMNWGFVLHQNERAPRRVTNVREDKILTSYFWRRSFEERRCLVLATAFCEPTVM